MKRILYGTVTVCILFAFSCKKTYQCKDQTGYVTGEVAAYSQSKANEKCRQNGSLSATLKPRKGGSGPEPLLPTACEVNGTGTLIFTNESDSVLKISIEGNVPKDFERVAPGQQVYTEVPAGKKYGFAITHSGGNYTASWPAELMVEQCKETATIIKF